MSDSRRDDQRRPMRAYQADLAYVHDVGFGSFAEGSAPGLLEILRGAGIDGGRVVDLGCGSGIWARRLLEAGYRVVGVDLSPDMIALARRRARGAEFHVASFLEFELPRCAAITALGEVLCFQFDAGSNSRLLPRFMRRAHEALVPGGVLIVDIAEVGLDRNRRPTAWQGADWACLVRFEYDDRRSQLSRHISTFRQVGQWYRRLDEVHRLQLYRRQEFAAWLRGAGFRVRAVRRYGDYELLPGRVGFVARKRPVA